MQSFTMRQLEIFMTVRAVASFRGAAERLGISEAAVSTHVRKLEQRLGYSLFMRIPGRPIVLSSQGYDFAKKAEVFVRQGRLMLDSSASVQVRKIRTFVVQPLMDIFLRPHLAAFLANNPSIQFEFISDVANHDDLDHMISSGRMSCALTFGTLVDSIEVGVMASAVFANPLIRKRIAREGLPNIPFVLWNGLADGVRKQEAAIKRIGVSGPNIVARPQHHDVAIQMAIEGHGAVISTVPLVRAYDTGRVLEAVQPLGPLNLLLYISPLIGAATARSLEQFVREALNHSGPQDSRPTRSSS